MVFDPKLAGPKKNGQKTGGYTLTFACNVLH